MSPRSKSRSQQPRPDGNRRARLAEQRAAADRTKRRNRILTGVFGGALLLALVAVIVVVNVTGQLRPSDTAAAVPGGNGVSVRADSHRLSNVADGRVTFVEFLDFECEACGAAYPAIEQLREAYGDRVSFVVRYFPLPGHFNAERAARAVEAAAQQGRFEAMYDKMFQTQASWGEQQVPKDDLFRSYAVELGLDMAQWDAAYDSRETKDRIQADVDDGKALGLTGTPAFFVNGEQLEPRSIDDLRTALDQALAR